MPFLKRPSCSGADVFFVLAYRPPNIYLIQADSTALAWFLKDPV